MFCSNCGNEIEKDSKFCGKCGVTVKADTPLENTTENDNSVKLSVENNEPTIKCGACGYVGPGEPARSMAGKILAWICVLFAPIVTIIYFLATHKYKCPKCKSTFLGVQGKDGKFSGQKGSNALVILIFILVGIAVIGILSSVVLASLNTARQKGADAAVKSYLSSTRATAEIYYDKNGQNYQGVCTRDPGMINNLSQASKSAGYTESDYICNDTAEAWAASVALKSTGYWCVDSTGSSKSIVSQLSTQTSCDSTDTTQSSANINWFTYTSQKDNFSILFPQYPKLSSKEGIAVDGSNMTYSYYSYEALDQKNSFFVYKYVYSDTLNITDEDKVLGTYLSSMENLNSNNKIISSSYTYQAGNRALDFLVKSNNEMLRGRYVLVGQTVYLAMEDYFSQDYDQATYNKFINSFKIQ